MAKKKMPVDIGELLSELTNLDGSRNASVSVSMYIDDSAASDVIAYTRNAFASASANARLSIAYLTNTDFIINDEDDFAVIVAGRDMRVGRRADEIRKRGIPVMVVTTAPKMVKKIALDSGYPLPDLDVVAAEHIGFQDSKVAEFIAVLPSLADDYDEGADAKGARENGAGAEAKGARKTSGGADVKAARKASAGADGFVGDFDETASADEPQKDVQIQVASDKTTGAKAKLGSIVGRATQAVSKVAQSVSASSTQNSNPYLADVAPKDNDTCPLTKDSKCMLSDRMGKWVIATCKEKGLAMAISFPFVRKPFSNDIVNVTAVQNAGVGVVFIIPGADMPVMTLNQCKMILQIAAAYGQDMTYERAREVLVVVAGGFACRSAARQVLSVVPIAGWAVKGTIGYTGTLAMGRAAIEYFENGSGISGLTGLGSKIKESLQNVVYIAQGKPDEDEAEQSAAQKVHDAIDFTKKAASGVANTAAPVAKAAAKFALGSFSAGVASMATSIPRK